MRITFEVGEYSRKMTVLAEATIKFPDFLVPLC